MRIPVVRGVVVDQAHVDVQVTVDVSLHGVLGVPGHQTVDVQVPVDDSLQGVHGVLGHPIVEGQVLDDVSLHGVLGHQIVDDQDLVDVSRDAFEADDNGQKINNNMERRLLSM